MGGQLALALAGQNARVGAVADFDGWHPYVKPDFDGFAAPESSKAAQAVLQIYPTNAP